MTRSSIVDDNAPSCRQSRMDTSTKWTLLIKFFVTLSMGTLIKMQNGQYGVPTLLASKQR
jgi:hypothetical protein